MRHRRRRRAVRLDRSQQAVFGPRNGFAVEPGTIEVTVCASSEDIRAPGAFEIQGDVRELSTADIVPTSAEID